MRTLVILVALAVLGCSHPKRVASLAEHREAVSFAEPPAGVGRVYLFVDAEVSLVDCAVELGTQCAWLGAGDFTRFEIEPGAHVLAGHCNKIRFSTQIVVERGGLYFVRTYMASDQALAVVPEARGMAEIRDDRRYLLPIAAPCE